MRPGARLKTLLASLALTTVLGPGAALAAPRVVAIGDIHGAYPQFTAMLQRVGLIDAKLHWSGGDSILVQVGDMLDRGAKPREVMDLLMRLQTEATQSGGQVIVLMGNHEAMNIVGDLRYVTPEIYAEFADQESAHRRKSAWIAWKHLLTRMARRHGWRPRPLGSDAQKEFDEKHPPGYFTYRQAMSAQGHYGKWLRTLPAAVQVQGTIFVHGGLSPNLSVRTVEDLNHAVANEISEFDRDSARLQALEVTLPFVDLPEMLGLLHDELQRRSHSGPASASEARQELQQIENRWGDLSKTLIMGPDGPLWFRGYANWTPEEGAPEVEAVCREWNASRIVVGHSPTGTPGDIVSRFGGRVYLIDTGMLPGHYPGGRPSALELTPEGAKAIYPAGEAAPAAWQGKFSSLRLPSLGRLGIMVSPSVALNGWMGAGLPVPAEQASQQQQKQAPDQEEEGAAVEPHESAARVWLGPDGKPLPFHDEGEILDFLRTADVVSSKLMNVGINATQRLTLQKDGIVARAIFRVVHEEKLRKDLPTGPVLNFKDSYKSEVSAYELSRLLGMNDVPPAVLRHWNDEDGSMQLFIEQGQMELDRFKEHKPLPNAKVWLQLFDMHVFDNVIGNIDRNQGNILYDRLGRLWLIDHTRSFSRSPRLPDASSVKRCSLGLWNALRRLDMAQLQAHLSDSLYKAEMKAVLERRDAVVHILQNEIAKRGRDAVLFDLDKALGSIDVLPSEPVAPAPSGPGGGGAAAVR